jgi:hypothetical protein
MEWTGQTKKEKHIHFSRLSNSIHNVSTIVDK